MSSLTRRDASLLVCGASLIGFAARAAPQSSFYKGRTIQLIVPFTGGGLNDIAARILAQWMPQYIPGHPAIVVENKPGAGGLALANEFAHSAPKDGTVIAAMGRALPQFAIMDDPNAHFDPKTFVWLGSLSSFAKSASLLIVNSDAPAHSVADLTKPGPPITLGANRIGSTNMTLGLIAKDVLGLNVKVVSGFPGTNDITLAMERHEVDGQIADLSYIRTALSTKWNSGALRPLIQFGRVSRLPQLPDVPTAREIAKTPQDLQLIQFAEAPFFMAAPFAAPAGVPKDRAEILREAFMKAVRDPGLLAQAEKAGIEVSPIDGATIEKLITRMGQTPKTVIQRFKRMTGVGN